MLPLYGINFVAVGASLARGHSSFAHCYRCWDADSYLGHLHVFGLSYLIVCLIVCIHTLLFCRRVTIA